jgi:hypothetical protein
VSPSWLERADIVFAAGALEIQRSHLLRRARPAPQRFRVEPQTAGAPAGAIWQAALDRLAEALAALPPATARVRLSGRFCRFTLAPWSPGLTPEEEHALARAVFLETYGDAAHGWEVRVDNLKRGAALVACAIDAELVAGLGRAFAAAGWRLASLEPLLAAALAQAARAGKGDGAQASWYTLLEPDWCSAALIEGEAFLATCGIPAAEPAATIVQALQNQNVRLAREVHSLRLLPGSVALAGGELPGWTVAQA